MGTEIAVAIEDVSKRFRLYQRKYTSLKERVVRGGRNPYEEFWALRDINIEVPEGQTIGILGRNGSGKSTLLKCICGVLQPTSGQVVVRGQLAGMLELGAGFQPELSGRDNIFLNGSLLGLSRRDVEARFDEIVAFAELEHFIDNQVKFYSSGMYVRLGFTVAVNVDPDVLVVDEVLAVGDENFQRKCVERIKTFQEDGRTIVFVTHSADLVRAICDRGVVLGDGNMLGDGTAGEAIRIFREHLLESGATLDPSLVAAIEADIAPHVVHGPIVITGTEVSHPGTGSREYLLPGEPLTVSVSFEASEPVEDAVFSIAVYDPVNNLVFGTDTEIMETHFDAPRGTGMVEFVFESVPLLDGSYSISLGIQRRGGGLVYDWREQQCGFSVMNPGRTTGAVALPVHANISSLSLLPAGD